MAQQHRMMINGTQVVSSTLQDRRNTRQYGVETSSRVKPQQPSSGSSKPEKPFELVRTVFRTMWGIRRARSRQDLPLSASSVGSVVLFSILLAGFKARIPKMWGLRGWGKHSVSYPPPPDPLV